MPYPFYGVLAQGLEGSDVRSDLEGLLDRVTPLYKARFEELPEKAQQLVDAIANHWDPISAKQLAERLGWSVNSVSAQLSRLEQQAIVEKTAPREGKRALFQLGERFFNIWYLMRSSRRVRNNLIWLVRFLRVFFSAEELQTHARNLHTLATLLVSQGEWGQATPHIERLIKQDDDDFYEERWQDILNLFSESVARGYARETLQLLDDSGAGMRWRPLREALAALASGNERYLNGVAPEVREPAQKIVERLLARPQPLE